MTGIHDQVAMVVTRNGTLRTIYSEDLEWSSYGKLRIRRGSHVEPSETGDWFADLSPVAGPRLGPFQKRSEALAAEVAWLREHWLM